MILTVCLNAALDVTYRLPVVTPGTNHRVKAVRARAGGKAINVARLLTELGEDTITTGFAGGATGREIRDDLHRAEVPESLVQVDFESRRTVTTVEDSGDATVFSEPGGTVSRANWDELLRVFDRELDEADVVVISGSIPPGVSDEECMSLAALAISRGTTTIVDVDGPALLLAAAAGASLLKPNAHELASALPGTTAEGGANALIELGANTVVVSLGEEGLLVCTAERTWTARLQHPVKGNATGAGDAVVAAFARGLARGDQWLDTIVDSVALSAAAVEHPLAGSVDPIRFHQLRRSVVVQEIT